MVDVALERALAERVSVPVDDRLAARYDKFRQMGREDQAFIDTAAPAADEAEPRQDRGA